MCLFAVERGSERFLNNRLAATLKNMKKAYNIMPCLECPCPDGYVTVLWSRKHCRKNWPKWMSWLNYEKFFILYQERFNTSIGRPTVPVQTYIRMMYLKLRYTLGYETLVIRLDLFGPPLCTILQYVKQVYFPYTSNLPLTNWYAPGRFRVRKYSFSKITSMS